MTSYKFRVTTRWLLLGGFVAFGCARLAAEVYDPVINPEDFTTKIDNPFFSMPVGKKMIYEARTEDGLERIEIAITGETRRIMGVETLVYHDREYLDGELVEETKDFIAQDKDGNVWYFGEEVDNYENGELKDHGGAWLAAYEGAKPGIWIKAKHMVGDSYRQEYWRGEAEDMAKIVATGVTVTTSIGTYQNCTKTYDWTPLDPEAMEHKYYCPEAGSVVLVENLTSGERVELIKVEKNGI
ncbi:MAG: hypothetical protein IMF05_00455 [Proteobacteria bacterium]|nr:hypothetical protein [Pseudomonadota bacterium]